MLTIGPQPHITAANLLLFVSRAAGCHSTASPRLRSLPSPDADPAGPSRLEPQFQARLDIAPDQAAEPSDDILQLYLYP